MGIYRRFGLMILSSTLLMYGLMYSNTSALAHIHFSQTRVWMALLMGAAMAIAMLGFMRAMYTDKRSNRAIFISAITLFGMALWLLRSQATVGDVSWMRAMTPHHSIAILTSERAHISEPQVRKLADGIIATQRREIAEMEALIADIERRRGP